MEGDEETRVKDFTGPCSCIKDFGGQYITVIWVSVRVVRWLGWIVVRVICNIYKNTVVLRADFGVEPVKSLCRFRDHRSLLPLIICTLTTPSRVKRKRYRQQTWALSEAAPRGAISFVFELRSYPPPPHDYQYELSVLLLLIFLQQRPRPITYHPRFRDNHITIARLVTNINPTKETGRRHRSSTIGPDSIPEGVTPR